MTERFDRVRELFEHASGLPAATRAGFLRQACGEDGALLAEVEGLLAAAEESEGYLDPPPIAAVSSILENRVAASLAGTRIGAFRLLRVVASGGMGTVFEAEQERPQRRVALKMMKLGFGSAEASRRFRYESEVLARLQHPAIAQIFEAGVHVERGPGGDSEFPWFAMEFVDGARSILRFADDEGLSIAQRLELFAQVCQAVHHGHQRAVIHRDLKPDNILVDDAGRPKIIDFGVARVTDSDAEPTVRTQATQIVGTLPYMSPEQISGNRDALDTRSDVYSLGVVLYELLVGQLPYDLSSTALHEVARVVREQPPTRPRTLRSDLAGDLEVLMLEALAKEPERRYASAAEFAADIGRFLRNEPIEARAPTLAYQLRMFARRNRVLVGAALVVVVVSIAAAAVSSWQAGVARSAESAERTQRERATRLFSSLLDQSVASAFEFSDRVRNIAGGAQVSHDAMLRAVENLEYLRSLDPDDRSIRRHLVRAYVRLGESWGGPTVQAGFGDKNRARELFARAETIVEELVAEFPDDQQVRYLALLPVQSKGNLAYGELDYDRAVPLFDDLIASLRELGREFPDNPEYPLDIATTYQRLGVLAGQRGDHAGALAQFEHSAEILRELESAHPKDDRFKHALSVCLTKIGAAHLRSNAYDAAVAALRESSERIEALAAANPQHAPYRSQVAANHSVLAVVLLESGDAAGADVENRAALATYREMATADPDNARYRVRVGLTCMQLGDVHVRRAKQPGLPAEEALERWSEARTWYTDGRAELGRLHDAGKLPGAFVAPYERTARMIETCEEALGDR